MNKKERDRQITEAVANGESISDVANRFGLRPPAVGKIVRANGVVPIVSFGLEDQEQQERILRRGKYYSDMEERLRGNSPCATNLSVPWFRYWKSHQRPKKSKPLPEAPTIPFSELAPWCVNAKDCDSVYVAEPTMSTTGQMRSYVMQLRIPRRRFSISRHGAVFRIICWT